MNEEFAVDESGMTADGYRILNPVSKKSMYLGKMIYFVFVAICTALLVFFSDRLFGDQRGIWTIVIIAIFCIIALYLLISPIVFYKRYRYRLDDDKVEIRRGVFTVTHTLVPIERIHQVEVRRGPINKLFGLADVNITTAGGLATLEYLDEDVAESIASKLNDCVVRLLKDRE